MIQTFLTKLKNLSHPECRENLQVSYQMHNRFNPLTFSILKSPIQTLRKTLLKLKKSLVKKPFQKIFFPTLKKILNSFPLSSRVQLTTASSLSFKF